MPAASASDPLRHADDLDARAFSALSMSPIALVTALSFVSPDFASVVAILFLRERSTASRWFAVAGGIVGMLLIVRHWCSTRCPTSGAGSAARSSS
ncbi:MAG: hypothetical protein ABI574_02285 [Burkholderiales bacterium]